MIVVRQDGHRYTVSTGMGSTTQQHRGSYATVEEAARAGLAHSAERYAEAVEEAGDLAEHLTPHAPRVLVAEAGVSAWDAQPLEEVAE